MNCFNNEVFKTLITDLINDAFYIDELSIGSKIAIVRKYSEVIIRRILDISNDESVTIGNSAIKKRIKEKSNNNLLLLKALDNICSYGNKGTHTQKIDRFNEDDLAIILDSLFDLYAYLFIEYFEQYEFGNNNQVVSAFSILPPIIRYKTLNYLNQIFPKNLLVIDKLGLAILKAFNKDKALEWIEERKETLTITPSFTNEAKQDLIEKIGLDGANLLCSKAPNMYNLCIDHIEKVSQIIEQHGKRYNSFEDALDLYREKGPIDSYESEIVDFNSIMEFCYIGRKTKNNEIMNQEDKYWIINKMSILSPIF
jgi:hypothetical protein